MKSRIAVMVTALVLGVGITAKLKASGDAPDMQSFPDDAGAVATYTSTGTINFNSAFFQNLGTNGRTCASCHQQSDAWSVSADHIRDRFNATLGSDPIFRPVDGAVCPTADVSTVGARQKAYRLLLSKGLIRVAIGFRTTRNSLWSQSTIRTTARLPAISRFIGVRCRRQTCAF